jgi:thiol-disulfide isomerase/thioredoxin
VIFLSSYPYQVYGVKNISPGMSLPQFKIDMPDNIETKQYLGLKGLKSFTISQIPAKLILIEIFSFYCPICHKQAPIANRVYKFIQQNPELGKDVKMIGIGAGNNQKEIAAYKATFHVQFPLFPDPDFYIHKKLWEQRTPCTILLTKNGKVLLAHYGVMEDVDEFLQLIEKFHKQQ